MEISQLIRKDNLEIYNRAVNASNLMIEKAQAEIEGYSSKNAIDISDILFAVVGSIGRLEALETSDLDLIPIARNQDSLQAYIPHDKNLREHLRQSLKIAVSKGDDLTKPTTAGDLTESATIGGERDCSSALTKRILLLTEGRAICGGLDITQVKEAILDAYNAETRTRGRHVLSLCNDVARYYRTLCIEYKAKVDDEDKDWCSRNIKLRHSRKFWYFSTMFAIAKASEKSTLGTTEEMKNGLLHIFSAPPMQRLCDSLSNQFPTAIGLLLEHYTFFLDFMSKEENKASLAKVEHTTRYVMSMDNPFPVMKFNSDMLHNGMMGIIEGLAPEMRSRIIGWFLL